MAETFNSSLLRRISQNRHAVSEIVPRAVSELIEISERSSDSVGSGLQLMGRLAVDLVDRIPKNLEDGIVFDFAATNGLRTSHRRGKVEIPGILDSVKTLKDFDADEFLQWSVFIDGVDTQAEIGREGAVVGLYNIAAEHRYFLEPLTRYLGNPGEEQDVERAIEVVAAAPYHYADVLLPDGTEEELELIFSASNGISDEEYQARLRTVRRPFSS